MLPRAWRLRQEKEIEALFKRGKSVSSPALFLRFGLNKLNLARATVIAGLKVHKRAVKRNRLKRQLREILHGFYHFLPKGVDLALVVKPAALEKSFSDLKKEVLWLLQKAGLWQEK